MFIRRTPPQAFGAWDGIQNAAADKKHVGELNK